MGEVLEKVFACAIILFYSIESWERSSPGLSHFSGSSVRRVRQAVQSSSVADHCVELLGRRRVLCDPGCGGNIKVFDVDNFDLINMIKLSYKARTLAWVHRPGSARTLLAVTDEGSATFTSTTVGARLRREAGRCQRHGGGRSINIRELNASHQPIFTASKVHRSPVHILAFNAKHNVVYRAMSPASSSTGRPKSLLPHHRRPRYPASSSSSQQQISSTSKRPRQSRQHSLFRRTARSLPSSRSSIVRSASSTSAAPRSPDGTTRAWKHFKRSSLCPRQMPPLQQSTTRTRTVAIHRSHRRL